MNMMNSKPPELMNYLALVVLERMGEINPNQQQIDETERVLQLLGERLARYPLVEERSRLGLHERINPLKLFTA